MITIVSGLPRSGTSMMMQMLNRGGLPILTDAARPPDPNNPRGYMEYAPVKRLRHEAGWLADAEGKALKVIAQQLPHLDDGHTYRVLFMERDIDEVLRSQTTMLEQLGRPTGNPAVLRRAFEAQVAEAKAWLAGAAHTTALFIPHRDTIQDALAQAHRVQTFLEEDGIVLDAEAMAAAVDPDLYRQRER